MFDSDLLNDDEFPGGVFSKEIEGGRAGATIRLGDRGVSARIEDGFELFVAYSECQLEIGGNSGRMIFCRTPDRSVTIFCEDRRFLPALRQAATGELTEAVEAMLAKHSQRRWSARLTTWGVLVLCLVLLVGGYFVLMSGARAAVAAVPFAVDQKIGEAALPSVLGQFGSEIKDAETSRELQALIDSLNQHSPLKDVKFKVLVVESGDINAMALPGGTILILRGLLDTVKTPGELAGVLAHEISHVTMRHHLQQLVRTVGVVVAIEVMLGDVGGLVALGSQIATQATLNGYSQSQELEADREGVKLMHAAGYDPHEMVTMFENLPDANVPEVLSWLSTHPDSGLRAATIRQLIAELPRREYNPPALDLEALRERLGKARHNQPVAE